MDTLPTEQQPDESAASDKSAKPPIGGGIVFLLFGMWLIYAGRSAATHGDVVSTEHGAGWITPTTAYIVAALCLSLAGYLFIARYRWAHRER